MSVLRTQLRSFAGLGEATYLWPRWLVLRAIGVVFVVVFAGIIHEGHALVGPSGLAPLAGFFSQLGQVLPAPVTAFLHAPSLFWLGHGSGIISIVSWLGLAAALALLFNFWPRLALFGCWLTLLSFVATWQIFSATQVDQLMLETALLAIPFAPAGLRPGLGAASPPRALAVVVMRFLLLRVMAESGLIKLLAGDPRWFNLTALDVLYETAPFPTILGYLDHQLPHAWHVSEIALTFAAEFIAPVVAIFGGRRGRWIAFLTWTIFQTGIQLTCNFGWLNTAAIALGLLLLDDQMLTSVLRRFRPGSAALLPAPLPPPSIPAWRLHAFRAAVAAHFALTLYFMVRVCGDATGADPNRPLPAVVQLAAGFRSANAYTLYGALLPHRFTVEFEGSNDGGATWRAYEFRYQPQREDQISPFLAPYYPRFEATLQVLGNAAEPSPLYRVVAAHLLVRTPGVLALFRTDPFRDRAAQLVRLRGHRFTFTDRATQRATGRYWTKTYDRDYLPMSFLNERGAPTEAASALDELRACAMHGNPEAQHQLGTMFAYGEGGVTRDVTEAARWFRRAADRGHPLAQFFLGLCFAKGDGVPQNYAEAAKYYRLAALQENVPAQVNLGFLHARGEGVAQDEAEALAWFALAAQSGQKDAVRVQESFAARSTAALRSAAALRRDQLAAEIAAATPRR